MRPCLRYRPAIISLTGNSSHSTFSHVADSDNAPETRSRASHSFLPRRSHTVSLRYVSTSHPRCSGTLALPSRQYISDIRTRGQEHLVLERSTSRLYSTISAPISHTRIALISHPSSRLQGIRERRPGVQKFILLYVPSLVFLHQDQ